MKAVLQFLFLLIVLALVVLACWGIALWHDWPLWSILVMLLGLVAAWYLFKFVRHLWRGWRQRSLTATPVEKPEPVVSAESQLKAKWKEAIALLKRSNLRQRGNPLYVLPWYMVIGRSGSGKTTALTRARLASPVKKTRHQADAPEQTLNVDWWFFDRAIVIDTAGRYVAADDVEEDRKEWDKLLDLLGHYRAKEGVNGIVLTVQADRLMNVDDDAMAEEGRVIRMRIEQLIRLFDKRFPIYVLVTKCDLIYGMEAWTRRLPEGLLSQAMGYVDNTSMKGSLNESQFVDSAFESVSTQLRRLQLAMLQRSDSSDPALMLFPNEFQRLHDPLQRFLRYALGDSPYLESPFLRGLFFSSGLQAGGAVSAILKEIAPHEAAHAPAFRGMFLHDLFDRVLPADRYVMRPAAIVNHWRRTTRHLGLAAWLLFMTACGGYLTFSFANALHTLNVMRDTYPKDMKLVGQLRQDVETLERFRGFAYLLEKREQQFGNHLLAFDGQVTQVEKRIKQNYVDKFRKYILPGLDDALSRKVGELVSLGRSDQLADYIQTFVRRINMVQTVLGGGSHDDLRRMPPLSGAVLFEMDPTMSPEAASHFNEMYVALLAWQPNDIFRLQRLDALKKELNRIALESSNLEWVVSWADAQPGLSGVQLADFWRGSRKLDGAPTISPAFTRAGKKRIDDFLVEVAKSAPTSSNFDNKLARFNTWYLVEKTRLWQEFAWQFASGEDSLQGEAEWRNALARVTGSDNPFMQLSGRLITEFSEVRDENLPGWLDLNRKLAAVRLRSTQGAVAQIGALNDVGGKLLKELADTGDSGKVRAELAAQIAATKHYAAYATALNAAIAEATSGIGKAAKVSADFHGFDRDPNGKSALQDAYARLGDIRRVLGDSSKASEQVAWGLLAGPIQFAAHYADTQASCALQKEWESKVIFPNQSVTDMGELVDKMFGAQGTVWAFVDGPAKPYVKRGGDSFELVTTLGQQVPLSEDFIPFINSAVARQVGQKLAQKQQALRDKESEIKDQQVKESLISQQKKTEERLGEIGKSLDTLTSASYPVSLTGLPTGVDDGATSKVVSTQLTVQCAGFTFRLVNLNFAVTDGFNWSQNSCGDTTLQIRFADFSLSKRYAGPLGFASFLQDFRDGQHSFAAGEFSAQKARLDAAGIKRITVHYSIDGGDIALDGVARQKALTEQRTSLLNERQTLQQQLSGFDQRNAQARLQGLSAETAMQVKVPGRIGQCWNNDRNAMPASKSVRSLIDELVAATQQREAAASATPAPPPAPPPAALAPPSAIKPVQGHIALTTTDDTPQLQAAVNNADRWLAQDASRYTLQVWLAGNAKSAEQMLKRLASNNDASRIFAYPTRVGSRDVIAIAMSDMETSGEANGLRPSLPDFIQSQRPMLRTNSGIRRELQQFGLWR